MASDKGEWFIRITENLNDIRHEFGFGSREAALRALRGRKGGIYFVTPITPTQDGGTWTIVEGDEIGGATQLMYQEYHSGRDS